MAEKKEVSLEEQLNTVLEREDLFTQGYKPKQKLEISGEILSGLLGAIGEQNRELAHLRKAFEGVNMFISHMEQTNNQLALKVLTLHAKNIDANITHKVK